MLVLAPRTNVPSQLLQAEREAIVTLRNDGHISDEATHNVERELDLEDERLDAWRGERFPSKFSGKGATIPG
jgi:hypothetical protein